jgi:hypothetical protein
LLPGPRFLLQLEEFFKKLDKFFSSLSVLFIPDMNLPAMPGGELHQLSCVGAYDGQWHGRLKVLSHLWFFAITFWYLRFEGAVIAAEKAAYLHPENPDALLTLKRARAVACSRTTGNDLYKAGKMLEASMAYSEGLQYDPNNAILLCNRAACRLVSK